MTALTDSNVLLRMAYQAMLAAGVDADQVLARVGASRQVIDTPELRTPHDLQEAFWQAAQDVSGDPCIGLRLGMHMPVYHGQVLEYLFLSSPTFGEGLKRGIKFQRLVSDAANGRLQVEGDRACIQQKLWSRKLAHLTDCMVIGLVRFFAFVTDGAFQPTEIHVNHTPQAAPEDYRRLLGCPVVFEQDCMRLYFDAALLSLPSAHHEPALFKAHSDIASSKMAALERNDLVTSVTSLVAELLEAGQANVDAVAARLELPPRRLRTQLAAAGTNFNELLGDYRCRLAKRLLAGTDESIEEIVYLTGFAEPPTFYRAFKRWTGMTPAEYRQSKRR